jgi:hypothetical protein
MGYLRIGTISLGFSLVMANGGPAQADGNEMHTRCRLAIRLYDGERGFMPDESLQAGFCLGFVRGFIDANLAHGMAGQLTPMCLPDDGPFDLEQGVRVFWKYLSEHPERLHENETILALEAFVEAFPCTERERR